jgi:glycosyltransferase involved in cell wall biosynthesis
VRLAIVLEQVLGPAPGGTGRYAYDLAAALAANAPPDGAVSSWVAWHRDVAAARVPGVDGPHRLPLGRRPLALAWERGAGPRPRRADVTHAPTLLLPPKRGRLVVTIHDAVPWTHPETLTPRGVAFHRRMAGRAERDADRVVVPTQAVRDDLARFLRLGDRVVVVPPGMTPQLVPPPDAEHRAVQLGLPERYVLTAATLEPRKGLDLLIAAMAEPTVPPEYSLVITGRPGWGGVDPRDMAARAGLSPERLRVLGQIPDADLAVCFARASMLAMPSRAEGFGLPVLEAMSLGVPVVCTDVPALVEVAGGAAVTVSPDAGQLAAGIAMVATDPAMRTDLVRRGIARAADFDWRRSAATLWELYAEL